MPIVIEAYLPARLHGQQARSIATADFNLLAKPVRRRMQQAVKIGRPAIIRQQK